MSNYTPNSNGYFVCKTNISITNTELCKKQRKTKQSLLTDYSSNTEYCSNCKLDLTQIETKSLDMFNELEKELLDHVNTLSAFSYTPPSNIYFGKL